MDQLRELPVQDVAGTTEPMHLVRHRLAAVARAALELAHRIRAVVAQAATTAVQVAPVLLVAVAPLAAPAAVEASLAVAPTQPVVQLAPRVLVDLPVLAAYPQSRMALSTSAQPDLRVVQVLPVLAAAAAAAVRAHLLLAAAAVLVAEVEPVERLQLSVEPAAVAPSVSTPSTQQ